MNRRVRTTGWAAALVLIVPTVGCSDTSSPDETQADPSTEESSTRDASESIDGLVDLGDGRSLYVRCTGTGSPTVIMEGGDEDTSASYAFAESAVAQVTRTCVYDRANLGRSDPDAGPRGLQELVGDLEGLIAAADIPGPYVMVGTSGGGYITAGFALAHPEQIAGMLFVEVPAPFWNPPSEIVEATRWDSPVNIENRDYLQVEKDAWSARRRVGDIPVTVISNEYSPEEIAAAEFPEEASGMRGNVQAQRGWLALSPRAEQVVVHTGHAVEEADPELVRNAILDVVEDARRLGEHSEPVQGELMLASGPSVHYRCAGQGAPAILLEAGTDSGGTDSLGPGFVDPLAKATRVCTYDRLGTGLSDGAPDRKRTIDDLCDVQDEVREMLGLSGRSVLAGQSGGANLVIWCASRRPEAVAALVSIEGYHDDPVELAAEGFHWRDNPEHMDWVESSAMLDSMSRPIGKFPVLVISATGADSGGVENQKYWLALSSRSRQVVLQGGHDIHEEVPEKVAAEILDEVPDS